MAGHDTAVSPTDRSPDAWHDECPAVSRPQLPPADDRRNGDAHVRRRQTTKALEGDHSQLEGDSLTHRKPVKLMQHWCNVIKLPCSGHDTRCCILGSLEFCQQTVTDPIQQTVTVIKTAADERVYQRLRGLQSQ